MFKGSVLQPYDRPQPIIFMTYRRPKPRKTLINNCCTFDTLSQSLNRTHFGACWVARPQLEFRGTKLIFTQLVHVVSLFCLYDFKVF